jgi:hypothetical protein
LKPGFHARNASFKSSEVGQLFIENSKQECDRM